MAKNKHLDDSERLQIEQWLREGMSLKRIAVELGKSASTVSREIRAHAIESNKYAPYRMHNRCVKLNVCQKCKSVRISPTVRKNVPTAIIATPYARNSRSGCA
jgi:IS30 family transposase